MLACASRIPIIRYVSGACLAHRPSPRNALASRHLHIARDTSIRTRTQSPRSIRHIHAVPHDPNKLVLSDAQRSTIYALSTPPGRAGIAVVRVSGPDVTEVWEKLVRLPNNLSAEGSRHMGISFPWKLRRCQIVHPETEEPIDEGLAVYFKGARLLLSVLRVLIFLPVIIIAPRSFTAEDVLELHVHSGRAIVNAILQALACLPSCRLAMPGEFTRRAFLAGRLDLTQVEGLNDLINADTESQRRLALQATSVRIYTCQPTAISKQLQRGR